MPVENDWKDITEENEMTSSRGQVGFKATLFIYPKRSSVNKGKKLNIIFIIMFSPENKNHVFIS